ncbi:glutathione S-transferase theta-3-like [Pan paniscus]|uniref:glutathione S-transferase theta-3 n=1 Tax=Pan troglodytes TaxID=9598 RepID=UPI0007DBAA03|nr:glutathione S-transferase theta-3 [Pan troglodytes]XP_054961536.1 glutathione S-transferase theta-3-like [Pan paniscus]XP_054961537.1 glutathione S-transferase theta-3-like [Pan paniscus]
MDENMFNFSNNQIIIPVFLGESVPPEMLAATLAELDGCLQLLEDKFLRDQAFLTGSRISVAGLVAITELMHESAMGCGGPLGSGVSGKGADIPAHVVFSGCGTLSHQCWLLSL